MSAVKRLAGPTLLVGLTLAGGCGDGAHDTGGVRASAHASPPPTALTTTTETAVGPSTGPAAALPRPTDHRAVPVATGTPVAPVVPSASAPVTDSGTGQDVTRFEHAFAHEANDGEWAARTAARLRAVTSGSTRYASISHDLVDCKQTVCKLALAYDDRRVFEDYVAALLETMKAEPGVALDFDQHHVRGGRWAVLAYLARSVESTAPAR